MLSDRQPRSFLEPAVLARLSGVPLVARDTSRTLRASLTLR